jgi:hypothetical protein
MVAHGGRSTLMVDPAGKPGGREEGRGVPVEDLFPGGDMTADARSAVSAEESQQSVVGAGEQSGDGVASADRPFADAVDGAPAGRADDDGVTLEDLAAADGRVEDGVAPKDAAADAVDRAAANGRAEAGDATVDDWTSADAADAGEDGVALDDRASADPVDQAPDGRAGDGVVAEDGVSAAADGRAGDGVVAEDGVSAAADGRAEDGVALEDRAAADPVDQAPDGRAEDGVAVEDRTSADTVDPAAADGYAGDAVEQASPDGRVEDGDAEDRVDGVAVGEREAAPDLEAGAGSDGPAGDEIVLDGAVESADVDDPWIRTAGVESAVEVVEDDVVAAEVAEQLEAVVGEDSDAEPAEFAAAAVLDVLRASGWADAAEATELRAESARLRELLAEVIRDHRAREASMAGIENQQLHWLVPLLRAAHGVAFGSLGAKVALRTAVQDVPPEVLASAGLRIDYGVSPEYEDDR